MIDNNKIIYYNFIMKITKGDVKGVLKVLLVILFVLSAVGCTCYLFFKYLNNSKDSNLEVSNYLYSVERSEFLTDVNTINTNSKNGLELLITNFTVANNVAKVLAPYLLTYDVDDSQIIYKLNDLSGAEKECKDAVVDYLKRLDDATFNKLEVGAVYSTFSNYLVKFSKLINVINVQVENHSKYKNVDVKFSVIDCYCRIVEQTFSNLTDNQVKNETNLKNLDVINSVVKFNNINILTNPVTGSEINDFITNYNQCDKEEFAKNLKDVSSYSTIKDVNSSLAKAYHYFYVVFVAEV